jgi:N-acetylglutamate synthase-like GNAT family acetyltransferase
MGAAGLQGQDPVGEPPMLPVGWRVSIETLGSEFFSLAERLEYATFVEEHYCATSGLRRTQEYESWRTSSVFHVVSNGSQVVGVVRALVGELNELPIGRFRMSESLPKDPVCEYASLAIAPDARSSGVSEALYRSVWQYAVGQETSGLVAIVERWLLTLLQHHYGFGFRQLGPSAWYMGGECMPIGATHEEITANLSSARPLLWNYLKEGTSRDP